MRNRWLVAPALAAAAVVLAACGSNSSNPGDPSANAPAAATASNVSTVTIKTKLTADGTVLVNAAGHTLYWFANDTSSKSNCNGTCSSYWPPVIGKPVAAAGTSLPHGFGTIKRADGQVQATYDGHPLYTYTGDSSAGQVTGNDIDLSGGWWYAATPSGSKLGKSSSSSSSSSSSGGSSGSSSGGSSGSGW